MVARQRRGFITGGTWCADHNKLLEHWPLEDMTVEILDHHVEGGGAACNFATDIRRLDPDMPVETIGVIGDDDDGRVLIGQCDHYGIGRRGLAIVPGGRTHYTDAYSVRATGRRTHLYQEGTSALLSPDHFDFSATNARILHAGMPGIHEIMERPWKGEATGWAHVLKAARAAGLETNFELLQIEPERMRTVMAPLLGLLDYLVINDFEVGALAGRRTTQDGITDVEACLAAGAEVMQKSSVRVLGIHFPRGAIAFERSGRVTTRPSVDVPPSEVKGANGAGDAFAAGFLYAVHEDWPMDEVLRLAHASAAASLRAVGTTGSVDPWRQCLDLADRWGWRKEFMAERRTPTAPAA